MKYTIKAYSICEFGTRKDADGNPHQEDCTFPLPGKITDADRTFILCDGMGGHDAGEVASSTVCEAMGRSVLADGHDAEGVFTEKDFDNALAAAYDALGFKDSCAAKKMGTTMTFLKLHNQGATIAHIGDSRVYHIRPGKSGEETRILFETSDHSLVNDLIKVGELTREEARHSNQKNVITRAMQPNLCPRPKADIHTITDIRPGDYFYLCSDGMLEQDDMEDGTTLRNIFSDQGGTDENKVNILRSVTDDNNDNHTAIIVHVIDVKSDAPATAMPRREGTAVVSDPDTKPSPRENSHEKTPAGRGKGVAVVISFIVVALCVAAVIFCMKSCGGNKQQAAEVKPQTEAAPAESAPQEDEAAPAETEKADAEESQQAPLPTSISAPGKTPADAPVKEAKPAETPAAAKPQLSQEEKDAINRIKKSSEEGVVESDETKLSDKINNNGK